MIIALSDFMNKCKKIADKIHINLAAGYAI